MQLYPPIHEIEARAKALGLSLSALANACGFAKSTPHRWKKGFSPNLRTAEAIILELERRERMALKHLTEVAQSEAAE